MISLLLFCLTSYAPAVPTTAPSAAPSLRPAPVPQNVLAHGSDAYFWVAYTGLDPNAAQPTQRTRIYSRAAAREWQHISDLPTRIKGLANTGTQLAVLLEGGEWQLLSEDGIGSSGPPLPGEAKMIGIANDSQSLWAIALLPASAATRPAATEPAAATQPAAAAGAAGARTTPAGSVSTQPAGEPTASASALVLYIMKDGAWQRAPVPPLPADIDPNGPLSLTVVENTPWIAALRETSGKSVINVWSVQGAAWKPAAQVPAPPSPGAFKLLAHTNVPVLWLAQDHRDHLYFLAASGAPRDVALAPLTTPTADRAAAHAANYIRDVSIVDGRLTEQDCDPQSGAVKDAPAAVVLPRADTTGPFSNLYRVLLTLVLAFFILSSARRRRDIKETAPHLGELELADLGRRLAAGLIDAIPFLAPAYMFFRLYQFASAHADGAMVALPRNMEMQVLLWFFAALLIYVIHTAVGESLTGRSIGKWLLGLRVVKLDGTHPDSSSILIRNFLRVVDVGILGLPLLLIAYSPLHQRIGDVAAGTVVIRDRVRPEGNLVDPEKADPATAAPAAESAEPPAATGG